MFDKVETGLQNLTLWPGLNPCDSQILPDWIIYSLFFRSVAKSHDRDMYT